jgi:hypothetical protein
MKVAFQICRRRIWRGGFIVSTSPVPDVDQIARCLVFASGIKVPDGQVDIRNRHFLRCPNEIESLMYASFVGRREVFV